MHNCISYENCNLLREYTSVQKKKKNKTSDNKNWRYDENTVAIDMLSPSAGQYAYVQPRHFFFKLTYDCISYMRKIKQVCCYIAKTCIHAGK